MESSSSIRRILGIDYGSQRIGLAISDPLAIIAQPLQAIKNDSSLFNNLNEIVKNENIKLIVIGMPLNLKGQQAQKAEEVNNFIEKLKNESNVEIITWDERFTTTIAQKTMLAMGTKKKERQQKNGRVDSMAAALILQGYLDSSKHSRCC